MADTPISAKDFGASFKGFMEQMAREEPAEEPFFRKRLGEHFGSDPSKLAIVGETLSDANHPNLHLAVEAFVSEAGRTYELCGVSSDTAAFMGINIAQLVSTGGRMGGSPPSEGPVTYANVPLDGDRMLACVQLGLYLVKDGDTRLALLVQGKQRHDPTVKVEVLATDRAAADACLASLRIAMRKRNVYRGHIVSLSAPNQMLHVTFHRLPAITREQIILPAGVLERIERQSVGFAKHAERLHAAGRHLKRGMLLHGSPGTGKTLTAMYLAGRMPDRTVMLITGRSVGLLEQACAMARALQPATIILEDVDLIAEERSRQNAGGCAPLLFELLNQMDGLADDADILFVLTTNRPDLLEPALAARPGRIDQAVEVPPPDAECRRRLFELYGRGLRVTAAIEPFIERTSGASAAFIRELLRKAALFAADDGGEIEVKAKHFDDALHEMVVQGGDLTKRLLGAAIHS